MLKPNFYWTCRCADTEGQAVRFHEAATEDRCGDCNTLRPETAGPIAVFVALATANRYGSTEENHHRAWVIDQMVRALTGANYEEWVRVHKAGEAGPDTYTWDVGIAP